MLHKPCFIGRECGAEAVKRVEGVEMDVVGFRGNDDVGEVKN